MASGSKRKTTMAKLNRESKLRERRLDKQAKKDARNDCTFYEIRVTREKETSTPASLRPNDARQAFENLFKK